VCRARLVQAGGLYMMESATENDKYEWLDRKKLLPLIKG
jgi:hypothetical protein